MHPNPMAETSGPVAPSVRRFISVAPAIIVVPLPLYRLCRRGGRWSIRDLDGGLGAVGHVDHGVDRLVNMSQACDCR
jgi:hypothetical protein